MRHGAGRRSARLLCGAQHQLRVLLDERLQCGDTAVRRWRRRQRRTQRGHVGRCPGGVRYVGHIGERIIAIRGVHEAKTTDSGWPVKRRVGTYAMGVRQMPRYVHFGPGQK